jgi:hypothetical protein
MSKFDLTAENTIRKLGQFESLISEMRDRAENGYFATHLLVNDNKSSVHRISETKLVEYSPGRHAWLLWLIDYGSLDSNYHCLGSFQHEIRGWAGPSEKMEFPVAFVSKKMVTARRAVHVGHVFKEAEFSNDVVIIRSQIIGEFKGIKTFMREIGAVDLP